MATGAARLISGLTLVMFILPSQFGVDPLGTGARAGLLNIGLTGQQVQELDTAASTAEPHAPIVIPQERGFQRETVEFKVAPGEGMEYKYRLDKGEALLVSWRATGPVNYEFHAEPYLTSRSRVSILSCAPCCGWNSNYSVVFSWWDRVHRTATLNVPQASVAIGVPAYTAPDDHRLLSTLLLPSRRQRDYWRRADGTVPSRDRAAASNGNVWLAD